MKTFFRLTALCSMVLLAFTACLNDQNDIKDVELLNAKSIENAKSSSSDCEHVHWGYTGDEAPEFWKDLCPGWAACGGTSQSPINIIRAYVDDDLSELEFDYNLTSTNIVNNGHTVQFNCDEGNYLIVKTDDDDDDDEGEDGKKYKLLQFHYHGLSEHEVNGQHYPLEVHFVHKATDGNIAVVGIFFAEGQENELFNRFLAHFPHHEGEYSSSDMIELITLLPELPDYYTYSGSLTTPPCSEIVTWFVMRQPIEASPEQINEFSEILHNNYRPVQPLNGRHVYAYMND